MITSEFIEKTALFFHFALLDEARAQSVTVKAIKKFRQERFKAKVSGLNLRASDFVRLTSEQLKREQKQTRPKGLGFSSGGLILPEKSNFGPWFEFQKIADDKDFSAVLYSKILALSEKEIATGLNTSVGTVRFRISNGLKILGRICHLGGEERES